MNDPNNNNLELLNKRDVANLLGFSIPTINRWMKEGKIKYLKIGRASSKKIQISQDVDN